MSECVREMRNGRGIVQLSSEFLQKITNIAAFLLQFKTTAGTSYISEGKPFLFSCVERQTAERQNRGTEPGADPPRVRASAPPRPSSRAAFSLRAPRAAGGWRRAIPASLRAGCRGAARVGGIVAELPAPGQGQESAMAAAVVAAAASGPRAAAR